MPSQPSEVTEILHRMADGDAGGLDRLMPLVYAELRQLAARQLRNERPDHTLSPTSLVHEAFLRLTGHAPVSFEGRSHFFRVAALRSPEMTQRGQPGIDGVRQPEIGDITQRGFVAES